MPGHITKTTQACFFQLRRLRHVCCLLGRGVTASLVSTFLLSRLDYCNALLTRLLQSTTASLQRVMNAAARLVCNLRSRDHVTPALPIAARVQYKLCLLMHSAFVDSAPDYVRDMLHPAPERMSQSALRSATNNKLLVPRSRLKFRERAFSIAASTACNSLPVYLCAKVNTSTIEKLKTFLFGRFYSIAY